MQYPRTGMPLKPLKTGLEGFVEGVRLASSLLVVRFFYRPRAVLLERVCIQARFFACQGHSIAPNDFKQL